MEYMSIVKNFIKWSIIIMLMSACGVAEAKSIHHKKHVYEAITLDDYISYHCKKNCVDSKKLLRSVKQVAKKLDIDPRDLFSIIKVESAFRIKAVSGKNKGLMQVNVRWHRDKIRGKDVFNVDDNIFIGATIYKGCLNSTTSRTGSLVCYNGGGDRKYVFKFHTAFKEISKLIDLKEEEMDEKQKQVPDPVYTITPLPEDIQAQFAKMKQFIEERNIPLFTPRALSHPLSEESRKIFTIADPAIVFNTRERNTEKEIQLISSKARAKANDLPTFCLGNLDDSIT